MRARPRFILFLCLLACGGCGKEKSTSQLIDDLKASDERERTNAVRVFACSERTRTAQVVPGDDQRPQGQRDSVTAAAPPSGSGLVRRQSATDAVPALTEAAKSDRDARVREAAGIALSRIDPGK